MASDSERVSDWSRSWYFGYDSGFDFQKASQKVLSGWAGLLFVQKTLF